MNVIEESPGFNRTIFGMYESYFVSKYLYIFSLDIFIIHSKIVNEILDEDSDHSGIGIRMEYVYGGSAAAVVIIILISVLVYIYFERKKT